MTHASTVGIAAFAADRAGARSSEIQPAPRVRAASVIKPLLFWVGSIAAPFATARGRWEALARPAVTISDNHATAELWSEVGGDLLLASIRERTGVAWTTDNTGGEHPALRVMVTAGEVALAYASFASDDREPALQLRSWMRDVPGEQTFGVREVAGDILGVGSQSVGVKCGWFGGERAHAVALVDVDDRFVGAVVTTSRPPDAATSAACQHAAGNGTKLVAVHDRFAGSLIRSAMRPALQLATAL